MDILIIVYCTRFFVYFLKKAARFCLNFDMCNITTSFVKGSIEQSMAEDAALILQYRMQCNQNGRLCDIVT